MTGSYFKFGFHTSIGGKNDGITANYFLPLDNAGLPIVLKSIGDFGICQEVLELQRASGVKHVVAYRDAHAEYFTPNYDVEPQAAWDLHWQSLYQNLPPEYLASEFYKANCILHPINEPNKEMSDWLGWFCYAGAVFAVENGYRFGFPSFSTGEPEYEHWETPGMLAFLDYAGNHKANVVIDLHEYSLQVNDIWAPRDPDGNIGYWRVGRFTELFEVCYLNDIPLPLVTIGEFGWEENDIPNSEQAMVDMRDVQDELYHVNNILGAFIWYLGQWHGSMYLANKTHQLIGPVAEEALKYEGANMEEPNVVKHKIHLFPQDTTIEELDAVTKHLHPTRSAFTYSHDVVEATMFHSTPDGTIVAWDPERWDMDLQERFSWLNVNYEERYFSDILPEPGFRYEVWPCDVYDISQYWAANPQNYMQYCDPVTGLCLPGHGGVDIPVPLGGNIYAVADGVVDRVIKMPTTHNFGNHVYIMHDNGELTGYAHLQAIVDNLDVGDIIYAGELIGWADNTGHSFGHHLHFLRKRPGETYTDSHGSWPYSLHDPTPLLYPLAPYLFDQPPEPPDPPSGTLHDILPYFLSDNLRGPLYEVQTQYFQNGDWVSGPQQRHQTQLEGEGVTIFYHTKGGDGPPIPSEWEQLSYDASIIYRYIDTSPGNGRFYTLKDNPSMPWSAWCARYMAVGSTYERNPYVNVYNKSDCSPVSNGRDNTLIKLEAVYESMTFFTGITLQNVIKLLWLRMDGTILETYYYAIGFGLVGWENPTTRSAVSEIHSPGSRPDNYREIINCISLLD